MSYRLLRSAVLLASLAGAVLPILPASAQSPTRRIRGTIEQVGEQGIVVRSREGESLPIALAPDAAVSAVKKLELSAVAPGAYIGTAAMPQPDGTLKALEVLVFPDAMRGVGEGHSAWDLLPESTMTNATVAESVTRVEGRSVVLTYKGEQKRLTVPADVPVVTFVPADRTDLKVGTPVFLSAARQPDGSLRSARVVVGKDGVAPPM